VIQAKEVLYILKFSTIKSYSSVFDPLTVMDLTN